MTIRGLVVLLGVAASPVLGGPAATVDTADTSVKIQASAEGVAVVSLASPRTPSEWIAPADQAAVMPWVRVARVGTRTVPLQWRLKGENELDQPAVGHAWVFGCDEAGLELCSVWKGGPGAGPVEHELSIVNHGTQELLLPLQTTLAFDSICAPSGRALENWWVEKGAGHPGDVGVHRTVMGEGFAQSLDSSPYSSKEQNEPIGWTTAYDPQSRRGWYLGVESSGRVRISLRRQENAGGAAVHVEAGLMPEEGYWTRLSPGQTLALPPVFVGCYQGDVDDGCNRLRRWVGAQLRPAVPDPRYPLLVNNSWGNDMYVNEGLCRKMIDESAGLGLEMFHIDAGWFRGVGDWHPDPVKFPNGLATVADYAHAKGLKFGLWVGWTQGGDRRDVQGPQRPLSVFDESRRDWFPKDAGADWKMSSPFTGEALCLGDPIAAEWCLGELRRIVKEYKLDMLEHDQIMVVDNCTRADHVHTASATDVAYRAAEGYYRVYDTLRRENPQLLFEDCVNGGRMVDYGVVRRVHYVSITDTYDPLSNRRAFYDTAYALPPAMCECYIENHPVKTLVNFVHMLRSGMMGWCTIMLDTSKWSAEQHAAAKRQFNLYKSRLRPLIAGADLYHVSERPDGVAWDGMEYWDRQTGQGVVFVFRGTTPQADHRFVLKGLDAQGRYAITSEDGGVEPTEAGGEALLKQGVDVHLGETESSDLIFLQRR